MRQKQPTGTGRKEAAKDTIAPEGELGNVLTFARQGQNAHMFSAAACHAMRKALAEGNFLWQYKESPKAAMADIRKAMGFLGTEGDSTMMDGRQLQQARIGAGLKQTDVIPHLRAVEKQADASLLSKYENGICLPTGPQLQALCALYGVKLPAFSKQPDARKGDRHKKSIRIQARIPVSKALPDAAALHAAIHRAGWKSAAEWMKHCVGELAGKMDGCI